MARLILIATDRDEQNRELAGLMIEAKDGDSIIVETPELARAAQAAWERTHESGLLTITVDSAIVEEARGKTRAKNAEQAVRRLTGAERNSPRRIDVDRLARYGIPGSVPGVRIFGKTPGETPTE